MMKCVGICCHLRILDTCFRALLTIKISNCPHYDEPDGTYNKNSEKNMKSPDETRTFEKGKVEIAKVGETSIGRAYFEPGWSWEKCVKPIAKTERCQAPHTQYIISGRM
jgi:hypothetical protein